MLNFLSDCMSRDPSLNELFIVETKNVAMAKSLRDRITQAVIDVTPSIIKVKGARIDRVLDNLDIKSIYSVLGVGIDLGRAGSNLLKMEGLRYHKIIIATEPTDEGRHIQTQVLAFMRKYMNPVIANGHVYLAEEHNWSSLPSEEFNSMVMLSESRLITQVPAND